MAEHLRFSVAYWHTFTADLSDPFGVGAAIRDWDNLNDMDKAKARVSAIFEFMEKQVLNTFVSMTLISLLKEKLRRIK